MISGTLHKQIVSSYKTLSTVWKIVEYEVNFIYSEGSSFFLKVLFIYSIFCLVFVPNERYPMMMYTEKQDEKNETIKVPFLCFLLSKIIMNANCMSNNVFTTFTYICFAILCCFLRRDILMMLLQKLGCFIWSTPTK